MSDTDTTAEVEAKGPATEGGGETSQEERSVYTELLSAVQAHNKKFATRRPQEAPTKYMQRLVEAVSELPEDKYDELSPEAREWFEAAGTAYNEDKELPELPGYVVPSEAEVAAEKKSGRPAVEKKGKTKEPKPPKEPKERTTTAGDIIRGALVENQKTSDEDIMALLKKAGIADVSKATLNTYKTHAIATLKVAASLGKFKANPA